MTSGYEQLNTFYHRLVGLTLLRSWWDDEGELLGEGYAVPAGEWGRYHVHHRNHNTWDVSLENLAVVTIPCHLRCRGGFQLQEPPVGWGKW